MFKLICDLVVDPEFVDAEATFYQEQCQQFDEGEENKLEYTQIHEKFILILEQLIEARLKEQHGLSDE